MLVKVDVDENSETTMKHSMSTMPVFVFIKKCDVFEKLTGANFPKLESIVRELSS